jgi:hypothetical protein
MTGRTIHELALVAAALARNALREDDARTGRELAQVERDQQLLMADLDRAELELVTGALAAYVAEIAEALGKKAGQQIAGRILEQAIQRSAALAAENPRKPTTRTQATREILIFHGRTGLGTTSGERVHPGRDEVAVRRAATHAELVRRRIVPYPARGPCHGRSDAAAEGFC